MRQGLGWLQAALLVAQVSLGAAPPEADQHGKPKPAPVAAPARVRADKASRREVSPAPARAEVRRNGGQVVEVRLPSGAVIRHGPGGARSLTVPGPEGRVIVAEGRNGYVSKPFEVQGQPFLLRTYPGDGATQVYRVVDAGGRSVARYVHDHEFRPAFYRWAAQPFRHAHTYPWGREGAGYFRPYASYPGPTSWLVDFMLATTLDAANPAQVGEGGDATSSSGAPAAMPPEVKQALADEVRRQLEQRAADPDAPPDPGAAPAPQVLLVSGLVRARRTHGRESALLAGDILTLAMPLDPGGSWVEVKLVAGRSAGSLVNKVLQVQAVDLLELQNQMQATLDRGLDRLQAGAKGGTLPAPPEDCRGVTPAAWQQDVPPDPGATEAFARAVKETEGAEQEALSGN